MSLNSPRSFADMVVQRIAATPDREAFRFPQGQGWGSLTWRQVGDRVRAISCGLIGLGLKTEERCGLLSATSLEWILADLGIMCAGGATTTVYPSSTPEDCAYILRDSASRFVIVENREQLDKLAARRSEMPGLSKVIVMSNDAPESDWVLNLSRLEEQGKALDAKDPKAFEKAAAAPDLKSLATLLYTSGTTGKPKGVELIHDCWVYEAWAIDQLKLLTVDDVQYLWLPLSHSFGKVLEAAQIAIGFITAVDGRVDKMVENLAVVKPSFVAAVPRVFEKVHNKVLMGAQEAGGIKLSLFRWAMEVGRQASRLERDGKPVPGLLALKRSIADKLVFVKLRDRFGGKLKFFISGAAPLSLEIAEFFHAANILIAEGYGLTESSAASFVNRPEKYRLGTVGLPLPGTEVKLAPEDSEILIKGRGIMRGYHNLPDATAEALDAQGYLHTGDVGFIDESGFLRITDRKKDLIKTSGGKYVAPQGLESRFKAICPYLSQVVVHGDNRNFCTALVTLDEESMRKWARENGLGQMPMAELAGNEKVRAMVQGYLDQLNASLASYESVKKFAILGADFTVESGELTASLKVKRRLVEKNNKTLLDGFYSEGPRL